MSVRLAERGIEREPYHHAREELSQRGRSTPRQVEADAADLERYPENQAAILGRAIYLKHLGGNPVSLREMRATATNGVIDYFLAFALYRQGSWEAALEVAAPETGRESSGPYFMRGYILPELPRGPQLACDEVQRLWQMNPSTCVGVEGKPVIPTRLGQRGVGFRRI
jgi:hypothetical protein